MRSTIVPIGGTSGESVRCRKLKLSGRVKIRNNETLV